MFANAPARIAEALSRILAVLPLPVLAAITWSLGRILWILLPGKRWIVHRNFLLFFPDLPAGKRRSLARKHFASLVEYGILVLLLPRASESLRQRLLSPSPETEARLRAYAASDRGTLMIMPHYCLIEATTLVGKLLKLDIPMTAVFRPLKSASLNEWILRSRTAGGSELISRVDGLRTAAGVLRKGKAWVAILFDQNAGNSGVLDLFGGALASCSPLPDLLQRQTGAAAAYVTVQRKGFLRGEITVEPLEGEESLREQANRRLEAALQDPTEATASWLWAHRRWKIRTHPRRLLAIDHRKIAPACTGANEVLRRDLPQTLLFHVALPDSTAALQWVLPYLVSLRQERPDAWLVGSGSVTQPLDPVLQGLFDEWIPSPQSGTGHLREFLRLRARMPDVSLVLSASRSAILFARLSGAGLRMGPDTGWLSRRFLSHPDPCPGEPEEASYWETYFSRLGTTLRTFREPSDPRVRGKASPGAPD